MSNSQNSNTEIPELTKLLKKGCDHRIGTPECLHCVEENKCPSEVEDVEGVAKIEGGRDYCLGQS
jgi:hypothetical protein